jgi:predicted RNA-binding Zn ribbon-like protein
MSQSLPMDALKLLGGAPALDFVNTVDPRCGPAAVDHLGCYADLARWAAHAGVLPLRTARRLQRRAAADGPSAAPVHVEALALRAALGAIFDAVAAGLDPPAGALAEVAAAYRAALAQAVLSAGAGFAWPVGESDDLRAPLWPVLRSAIELLTSPGGAHVKACPAPDCGWLFLDTSRNHSRRWCSMDGCGSRMKMRDYYARQKRR